MVPPELHDVAGVQRRNPGAMPAVDIQAVRRAEVLDGGADLAADDAGVASRNEWVVEMDVAAVRAADDGSAVETPLATTSGMHFQDGHGRALHVTSIAGRDGLAQSPEGWSPPAPLALNPSGPAGLRGRNLAPAVRARCACGTGAGSLYRASRIVPGCAS